MLPVLSAFHTRLVCVIQQESFVKLAQVYVFHMLQKCYIPKNTNLCVCTTSVLECYPSTQNKCALATIYVPIHMCLLNETDSKFRISADIAIEEAHTCVFE